MFGGKAQNNGPCKLIYPNGNTVITGADGRTWVKLHSFDDFRFEIGRSAGTVTGTFRTNIITKLPQGDIVQAPQAEMMDIEADCQSKTYVVYGSVATDVNGIFSNDLGSENFARRVVPGSPLEVVFGVMCKSISPPKPSAEVQKMMDQEDALNDRCRNGVTNPQGITDQNLTQKVCAIRDDLFDEIKTQGWCWGHNGQIGADRTWEPCRAKR